MTSISRIRRAKILIGTTLALGAAAALVGLSSWAPGQVEPGGKTAAGSGGNAPRDDPKWKAITKSKVETARQILEMFAEREKLALPADANFISEVACWSRRLMEAELELSTTKTRRIAAIQEHRDRMRRNEQMADAQARAARLNASDVLKARFYRLEADQALLGQGVSPPPDDPTSTPRAADTTPTPPAPPR